MVKKEEEVSSYACISSPKKGEREGCWEPAAYYFWLLLAQNAVLAEASLRVQQMAQLQ